jgi:polyphosphate kinase
MFRCLEKINFLSIYSSNLDEFYRVRMPVLLALAKLSKKEKNNISIPDDLLGQCQSNDHDQQQVIWRNSKENRLFQHWHEHEIDFIYGKDS